MVAAFRLPSADFGLVQGIEQLRRVLDVVEGPPHDSTTEPVYMRGILTLDRRYFLNVRQGK